MNTAEVLEAITDRGCFERLVISVLSKANRDYAAILHTGVNAAGEPVKSPVDGFCRVPGSSPPHFVMVQITTTEKRDLERKWLYDHTTPNKGKTPGRKKSPKKRKSVSAHNDGDLVKAGRLAQQIRRDHPQAEFTVVLATNQSVNVEDLQEVYKKAEEFRVTCDIWNQSRFADFLDNTHDGHWLRRQYLGIEAERLSESLLRHLCKQSLARYEKELFLTIPDHWVSREADERVEEGTRNNAYTIQFLIGESGFGKTTTAYQTLQKHLTSGRYGLWLPAELIRECTCLENALDRVLRDLYPHLLPDAGRVALQLIQEGSRLLLVVDDINRVSDPTNLTRKLLNWSKPQQSNTSDSQLSFSQCLIVCPVWPHVWGPLSQEFSQTPWVHTIHIGRMTSAEGVAAVQTAIASSGKGITLLDAVSLATRLGNDPILIGFFGSLLQNAKSQDLNGLAENIVEEFITSKVEDAADASSASCLPADYRMALSTVSDYMLRKRKIRPSWKEIQTWLKNDPDTLKALRELIRHGGLCRLSGVSGHEQFDFRHDRIQEVFLVESMTALFSNPSQDVDLISEAYYAQIIGRALLRSPQNREFLTQIRDRLPLALLEAIRQFGTPTSDYHQAIIEEAIKWARTCVATDSVLESVLDAACWTLLETDSPAVLEITETFPSYPIVLLARLRNGCAKSGARFCRSWNGFVPSAGDKLRDRVLEKAKWQHSENLLNDLKHLLASPIATDEEREGILVLAGFLGFTDLRDDIFKCWELAGDKTRILPEAIWAAARCCEGEPNELLDPLMAYWAEMPDEDDTGQKPRKRWYAEELSRAFARGIRSAVIKYFIAQYNVHESLQGQIITMCERIDNPDTIEFIVRCAADIQREVTGTEGISLWVALLTSHWDISRDGRRLSQPSMARLQALWEDPKSDEFVKQQAFRLWLTGVGWEHVEILRAIPSDSLLSRSALVKRAQLGDHSVVPDLIPLLMDDTDWFDVAHYVWCNEIMVAAEHHLEAFKNNIPSDFTGGWLDPHHELSYFLVMIPMSDAETLLEKYWSHLGYSRLFIQTALYVGTPKCLELAASSIRRCPTSVPIFEHTHHQFGFMDERRKYLTVQHLENLLPYLDRLDERELRYCADVCQRIGIPEWSQQHLANRLSAEHRKRFHPSDDDLLQDLDEFAEDTNGEFRVRHWLEGFDAQHEPRDRAIRIVDRWLASHPTIKGLQIAAACIEARGSRRDLSILDKYAIDDPSDEVAKIKASTRFAVYRRSID